MLENSKSINPHSLRLPALSLAIGVGFMALVFWTAGTLNLPFFWAVFAVQVVFALVCFIVLDPELIAERLHPKGKDEDPHAQKILGALGVLLFIVAALDAGRFHFSNNVPVAVRLLALMLHTAGWGGLVWSMKTNTFFSSAIRLQPDRHQQVISTGPYRWLRHPGYAFGSILFLSQALALGSWASAIPAVFMVLDLIYRTNLEERLLREGLPGYQEYSERVRYRWLPGVW